MSRLFLSLKQFAIKFVISILKKGLASNLKNIFSISTKLKSRLNYNKQAHCLKIVFMT